MESLYVLVPIFAVFIAMIVWSNKDFARTQRLRDEAKEELGVNRGVLVGSYSYAVYREAYKRLGQEKRTIHLYWVDQGWHVLHYVGSQQTIPYERVDGKTTELIDSKIREVIPCNDVVLCDHPRIDFYV